MSSSDLYYEDMTVELVFSTKQTKAVSCLTARVKFHYNDEDGIPDIDIVKVFLEGEDVTKLLDIPQIKESLIDAIIYK
jgi:hypothetical protein